MQLRGRSLSVCGLAGVAQGMRADLYSRRPSLRAMRLVYCSVMMSAYESTISCAVGCATGLRLSKALCEYSSRRRGGGA